MINTTPRIVGDGSGGGGGGPVTGLTGTPTQVVYIDNSGNGTGDAYFTRDSVTNETFISMSQNAGVDEAGLAIDETLLGVPGTNGLLLKLADQAGTVGSAIMGVLNLSPLGAPSNYGVFAVVDDAVTLESSRMFMLPNTIGFSASDGVDAGLMQLSVGNVQFGVDNADGGGNDFAAISANLNGGAGAQYIRGEYRDGTNNYGWGIDNGGVLFDFDAFSGTPGTYYYFPTADGTNGQILATNGAGQLSFTNVPNPALTQNYIGFGSSLNALTGDASFEYDFPNLQFIQTIPNNTGNSGATTSPLSFGAASFTGSGLNDLTLNWGTADYKSNKYGGNLQIKITQTSPDKFSWAYTGGSSQTIGSGTDIAITPGLPQLLSDSQGRRIGDITFTAGTGHTMGDTWAAGTSLSTYTWGQKLTDGNHNFIFTQPVYGQYYIGDGQYLTDLGGNGTRIDMNDNIGEMALYAARYFRVETPGGNTAVLADMQTQIWSNYGIFRVLDPASGSVWFDADAINHTVGIGDVQSTGNDTLFTVDDTNKTITGTSLISGTKNTSMKVGSIPGLSLPGSAFDYSDSVAGQSSSIGVGDFSGLGGNPNSGYMTWYTGATSAQSLLTTNSGGITGLVTDGTGATYTNQFNLGASGFTLSSNSGSYTFPLSDGTAGQAPITDGAGQLAWGSVAQIFTATETFSSANILNLNGTPRVMVSAAGAGKLIVPIAAYVRLTYNSAPYATNTSLVLKYAGTTNQIMNNDYVLLSTATNLSSFAAPNSSLEDNTAVNADLELTVLGGNPTAGNSVMDVEVQYIIVNVSI